MSTDGHGVREWSPVGPRSLDPSAKRLCPCSGESSLTILCSRSNASGVKGKKGKGRRCASTPTSVCACFAESPTLPVLWPRRLETDDDRPIVYDDEGVDRCAIRTKPCLVRPRIRFHSVLHFAGLQHHSQQPLWLLSLRHWLLNSEQNVSY